MMSDYENIIFLVLIVGWNLFLFGWILSMQSVYNKNFKLIEQEIKTLTSIIEKQKNP